MMATGVFVVKMFLFGFAAVGLLSVAFLLYEEL